MASIPEVQNRLAELGFNPGPIDGIWGRQSIAAAKAYQKDRGLVADGIVGPATLRALFPVAKPAVTGAPFIPWYEMGLSKKGLTEIRDKAVLAKFLKSDGATLGDPSKLPWCGDFVETCIGLTLPEEPMVVNPYFARNWARFGIKCEPTLGCVLVFERGPTSGHVGFYAGEDKTYFSVLGGNQSNSISISRVAKSRLIAARWPKTVPLGATVSAAGDKNAVVTTDEA